VIFQPTCLVLRSDTAQQAQTSVAAKHQVLNTIVVIDPERCTWHAMQVANLQGA
jgi:hypothetical protein